MWAETEIKKLWMKIITDLRVKQPLWMGMLKDQGYRAIVVDKKANHFGMCNYRKKTVSINLHLHRYSSEENIVDTMLHEIAHAIDHSLNGRSSGHGKRWRDICVELGATPKAKSKSAIKVEYKYVQCVHTNDRLYFIKGYNRRPAHTIIGEYQTDVYLRCDKEGTMGKIIVYPWDKWLFLCEKYEVGAYKEDHSDW